MNDHILMHSRHHQSTPAMYWTVMRSPDYNFKSITSNLVERSDVLEFLRYEFLTNAMRNARECLDCNACYEHLCIDFCIFNREFLIMWSTLCRLRWRYPNILVHNFQICERFSDTLPNLFIKSSSSETRKADAVGRELRKYILNTINDH